MLNIRDAKVITYDNNQKSVTVYQDFKDDNLCYVQPTPKFANQIVGDETIPIFSLLEYTVQSGDNHATCSFTVELAVSPEATQAVREALPNAIFGQFDWISADIFLSFTMDGEDYTFSVSPSLVGSNQAAFILDLNNSALVKFFIGNFGPGAPDISTLNISYDVVSLAKLQAVKATVKYDATKAIAYEKTVQTSKNMWGSVTSRRVTVRQNLKASDAGETILDWGIPDPSNEFQQRVNDWAFATLEGLVDQAVNDAVLQLGPNGADSYTSEYTASFSRSYEENQVIEWVIAPTDFLVAASISNNWDAHHQKVDFRRLVSNINVLGDMRAANVDSIDVTINYADVNKTHSFDANNESSWTFDVEGRKNAEGNFDPEYGYTYKVNFTDGGSFTTEKVLTKETAVSITLADLGFVNVTFDGSNIDFETIDSVDVNFIFTTPKGSPNINKTQRITDDEPQTTFNSDVRIPGQNFTYTYGFVYTLKDASQRYTMTPITNQGGASEGLVLIPSPFLTRPFTTVTASGDDPCIKNVFLTATYDDHTNNFDQTADIIYEPETDGRQHSFSVNVLNNPNGSFCRFNGFIELDNNTDIIYTDIYLSGTSNILRIPKDKEPFSVKFDPRLIAWTDVEVVLVNVFTIKDNAGVKLSDLHARGLEGIQDIMDDSISITFAAPDENTTGGSPPQYFTFNFDPEKGPVYYFTAEYFHKGDKVNTFVAKTKGNDRTRILPKDPTNTSKSLIQVGCTPNGHVVTEFSTE